VVGREFTEMTFRTPFENFIRQLNPDCHLLHEPSPKKNIGSRDFIVSKNAVKVGYIEFVIVLVNDKFSLFVFIISLSVMCNRIIFREYLNNPIYLSKITIRSR
jgi:hypothetical protein